MSNFDFLKTKPEFELFSSAAIEAERVLSTSPAMCAIGSRKALELAVKWVYAADTTMEMPYKDNLQSLIHEPTFRFALDHNTWGKLPYIVKLGNLAVHTDRSVSAADAVTSLRGLFEFVEWIDCCYGEEYEERKFDEKQIPRKTIYIDTRKIKAQESLLEEKESLIEELRKKISALSEQFTKEKEQHRKERSFTAEDLSEFQTRKQYIDLDLKSVGWRFEGNDADIWEEFEVRNMAGVIGQKGYSDYVLMGKDGLPLAVIEAKRTSKDPNVGRQQALLYANALEEMTGRRPMMFTTNGFETYFWDDQSAPQHPVSGVFSKDDLQRLMTRRSLKKQLHEIPINDKIVGRYYQKEAIRAVCDQVEKGFRKMLLVMATGTGKKKDPKQVSLFHLAGKKAVASGYVSDKGFVVLEGSQMCPTLRKSCSKGVAALRDELVEAGKVANHIFLEDVSFSSPSSAAAAVVGGSANGLIMWVNEEGKTLKELG